MAARAAYNQLMTLFKQHQLVTFASMTLDYDTEVYMAKPAAQPRASASFGLMSHNNNICREALTQYQIAFPGVESGVFTRRELANLRECNRMMNVARDMLPQDQQAYLRAVQSRQHALTMMKSNRERLVASGDWDGFASLMRDQARFAADEGATLNRQRSAFDNLISVHAFGISSAEVDRIAFDIQPWWPAMRDAVWQRQREETKAMGPVLRPTTGVPTSAEDANEKTEKLLREVLQLVGFDWQRGRIDGGRNAMTSPPPFDCRVVYRRDQRDPLRALVEAFHESGHAMFEQGVPEDMWFEPCGNTECKALHEAHSHWVEMFILRHPAFTGIASALLTDVYGSDPAFEVGNLARLFKYSELPESKAEPLSHRGSAMRDDLLLLPTVLVNAQLERELIEGKTAARELAHRYAALCESHLGFSKPVDQVKQSIMADPMWWQGAFGYIPVYANGVLYAAQLQESIDNELGADAVAASLESGMVRSMISWLRENVWCHGHLFETQRELVEAATKRPVSVEPWRRFLQQRYNVPNGASKSS